MKLTAHPLAEPLPNQGGAAALPVDHHLVRRRRVSLALLLAKGDELPATFYALLFERAPALRRMFPDEMGGQQSKLTAMLAWIVTHLERRDQIVPALRELGRRHAGYGARAEHYPLVRDSLIDAMARTAGPGWDEDLAEDWRLSIDLIARQMMSAAAAPAAATSTTRR